MNLLILFDYVFYRIAWFYDVRFKYTESKKLAGVGFLSLFQFFNIIALLNFLKRDLIVALPYYFFIIGYIVLCVCNYVRYMRIIKYTDLDYKWGRENKRKKFVNSVLIIIYFLLSFYLLAP